LRSAVARISTATCPAALVGEPEQFRCSSREEPLTLVDAGAAASARKRVSLVECFPYVCPKPVLLN
jgi:hypothetical protein